MTKFKVPAIGIVAGLVVVSGVGATAVVAARTNSDAAAPSKTLPTASPPAAQSSRPAIHTPVTTVSPIAVNVPGLHHLTPPDAVVSLPASARPSAVKRLEADTGVRRVAVLSAGHVTVPVGHHHRLGLEVAGVALQGIRGFTPKLTASSTALWKSVARGELTVSYSNSTKLTHRLGATLPAAVGGRSTPLRIGAFATLGLPGIEGLVSRSEARTLRLSPGRELLIQAPNISLTDLHADVAAAFSHISSYTVTRPAPVAELAASAYAISVIPANYLSLYQRAAVTCPGLPWTVLAGIGTVETGNGADVHKSTAGAEGPMQFLPSTWKLYGIDADGDGKADINDPTDAVFSAARYLCAAGASRGGQSIDDAIFSYNHAEWYVREVVKLANEYA